MMSEKKSPRGLFFEANRAADGMASIKTERID